MDSNNLLPSLPIDIIEYQILTRLPVKSLLRFQSVCKSWKLLISSNPYFTKTHLYNANCNSIMLRRCRDARGFSNLFYHFQLQQHSKIIGCINGLVCFFDWGVNFFMHMVSAIWNPATKQCLIIPALVVKSKHIPYIVGFGFDSVADDYKIVYVTTIVKQPLVGYVYSCNIGCWREIAPSNFLHHGTLLNFNQSAIVGESIYWLNQQSDDVTTRMIVISFDVRHEVFRLLPDSFIKESNKDVVLMNMRDSVAVIFYHWTLCLGSTIDVHIFDERCGVWSKMCIGPFGNDPTFLLAEKLLTCFINGDILFAGPDLKLYCIYSETHTIKSLKSPDKEGNECNYYYDGCNYSESLIFIEGMEKCFCKHEVEIFSLHRD